jgi:hypothetical protein
MKSSSQFWIHGLVVVDVDSLPALTPITIKLLDQAGALIVHLNEFITGNLLTDENGTFSFTMTNLPLCINSPTSKFFLLLVQYSVGNEVFSYVSTPFVSCYTVKSSSGEQLNPEHFICDVACSSSTKLEQFYACGLVITELMTTNEDVLATGNILKQYIGDVLCGGPNSVEEQREQVRQMFSDEVWVQTFHCFENGQESECDAYSSKQRRGVNAGDGPKKTLISKRKTKPTVSFSKGFYNRYLTGKDNRARCRSLLVEDAMEIARLFFNRHGDLPLFDG